jgi:LPPG:FO 2-phospho-L-lactate transferase
VSTAEPTVAVISGGVGAARMLRALSTVVDPARITAVVNTGDDTTMHGLAISPDLDTITYTLAGAIDPTRGWGLRNETWRAMEALGRFDGVRPSGSTAGGSWFSLGDQDLATHFYRTARLAEGADLTTVTDEIRRAFGVEVRLLPMSNERVATEIQLVDGDWIGFQDYFVRLRHDVAARAVRFTSTGAMLSAPARAAIAGADTVVIAPSNPIVSVGPIRFLDGVDELLAARRDSVVAVSPIVAGVALKGPADRLLLELGHEASVVGVARLYAPVAGTLVIDPADADRAAEVEAAGVHCVVTPSVMSTPEIAARLARATIAASH